MNNNKKCPHGFDVDPVTGEHIIPKNRAIPINEAAKLYQQNKEPPIIVHRALTEREKELEESRKKWDRYFRENRGKISAEWPRSIFDKNEE
jgi:hypothetical protein